MVIKGKGQFEFGANSICGSNQNRVCNTVQVRPEQTAKTAYIRNYP
jgi:hypothetical protein